MKDIRRLRPVILVALASLLASALVLVGPTASPASSQSVASSSFTPDVSVTVPFIDMGLDGVHDFSGQIVNVFFEAVSSDCAYWPRKLSWQIEDDGTLTRQGQDIRLFDARIGVSGSCSHNQVPAPVVSSSGDLLLSAAGGVINSDTSLSVDYALDDSTFFLP